MDGTVLGLPGDLAGSEDFRTVLDWRVGGKPSLPAGWQIDSSQITCSVCHHSQSFVSQVCDGNCGRVYLVFGCTKAGCGRLKDSWKAFCFSTKGQGSPTTSHTLASPLTASTSKQKDVPDAQGHGTRTARACTSEDSIAQNQTPKDAWGVDTKWGISPTSPQSDSAFQPQKTHPVVQSRAANAGTDQPAPSTVANTAWGLESDDDGDYTDLLNQLDSATKLSATKAPKQHSKAATTSNRPQEQPQSQIPSTAGEAECSDARGTDNGVGKDSQTQPLENPGPATTGDSAALLPEFRMYTTGDSVPAKACLSRQEEKHISELLRSYEADGNSLPTGCDSNSGGGDESWAAEKYEPSALQGVDPGFLKFSKHLQRSPEQCVRVSGPPLWPEKKAPQIPQCAQCNSVMVFSLQLMPPLMTTLDESAEWLGLDPHNTPLHDWEWTTIAVFACSRCCDLKDQGPVECAVIVANE